MGASSAGNRLAHQTSATRAETHRTVRFGRNLVAHPMTRDALAAGEILGEQARVILRWVEQLPSDIGPEKAAEAEAHLLTQARDHDAKALNHLGRHLFEVIAPDEADAREAAILEREEVAAAKASHLTMRDDGRGRTHGTFTLPTFHGAALRKVLGAIMAPQHQTAT